MSRERRRHDQGDLRHVLGRVSDSVWRRKFGTGIHPGFTRDSDGRLRLHIGHRHQPRVRPKPKHQILFWRIFGFGHALATLLATYLSTRFRFRGGSTAGYKGSSVLGPIHSRTHSLHSSYPPLHGLHELQRQREESRCRCIRLSQRHWGLSRWQSLQTRKVELRLRDHRTCCRS
jgi:hypothetical protein